ncbi:glycoside hydrolase family 6 protein [Oerskovia sp. Root22]|uniref:glycoside hydrolase family 6 protein n=1 Tax=Oerskovia sp. Root22 TaxID=1736494 RepID=UPI0006F5D5F2|nr:glycoside hydrolase family 6 protein [Oerskovia sp. Root22]KRC42917.1 endoglucanase [Oerskovia sp. Root22]
MPDPRARTALTASVVAVGLVVAAAGAVTAAQATPTNGCRVDYAVSSQWTGGFQGTVDVTNLGSPVSSWELAWTFADGQQVSQAWNGTVQQTGSSVVVRNVAHNGSLATGANASFGFIGSSQGANSVPVSFSLGGTVCTGKVTPTTEPTQEPTPTPTPTPTDEPTSGPSTPSALYVDTTTQAYTAWSTSSGTTRTLLEKIALTPQSYWVGNWDDAAHARDEVADYTGRAVAAGRTPLLTVYAIPGRDCGNHSAGGVGTSEYARWIDTVAAGIQGEPWVVLEPDALAQLGDCSGQGDRVGYLRYAAQVLSEAGAHVYIDAGHSAWLGAGEVASRLQQVGFDHAEGFALNTSNYRTTAESRAYGEQVSALVGGKPFVIDTSRNGNGSTGEWCNPRGRALGERPRLVDDGTHLAALLWVKLPGESDGACNGGPAAGAWWQDVALELAANAQW